MREVRDVKRTAMLDRERNMCAGFVEVRKARWMKEEGKGAGKEIEKEGGVYVAASHRPKPARKDASQRMKKSPDRPRYPTLVYHLKSSASSEEASSVPSDESVSGFDFNTELSPQGFSFKLSRPHRPGSRGLTTYVLSSLSLFSSSSGLPLTDSRTHTQPQPTTQSRTSRPMTLKFVLKPRGEQHPKKNNVQLQ